MTDEEKYLLELTIELWNKFLKLPIQHPDDINEFRAKIHDIQRMITCRALWSGV